MILQNKIFKTIKRKVSSKVSDSFVTSTSNNRSTILKSSENIIRFDKPIMKLTTNEELSSWYHKYQDFVKHRENMKNGHSEKDFLNANLKLSQDLAVCDFFQNNLAKGSKVLEIGGGFSRILSFFNKEIESWNLDKFEGVGNGPQRIPKSADYKIVQNYIGALDKTLPRSYFDIVFSISVIEHINEDENVLEKILEDIDRILKPGGLNVHCIDCRFTPGKEPDISNRKLAKYMIEKYGFNIETIYENYTNANTFTMSGYAYNRDWRKYCGDRPWQLDGLPFNIFLATIKQ